MKAAVETFERFIEKEKIPKNESLLILGDMKELGAESIRFHEELGEFLLQKNFENVFFVGEFGKAIERRLESVKTFESTKILKEFLKSNQPKHKCFFLKGSRALALETVVDNLASNV